LKVNQARVSKKTPQYRRSNYLYAVVDTEYVTPAQWKSKRTGSTPVLTSLTGMWDSSVVERYTYNVEITEERSFFKKSDQD
jgi:hypothetical protein